MSEKHRFSVEENWCAEKLEKIKVSKNVVDYFQNYVEESCEVLKEETDFIVSETHEKAEATAKMIDDIRQQTNDRKAKALSTLGQL